MREGKKFTVIFPWVSQMISLASQVLICLTFRTAKTKCILYTIAYFYKKY